MKNMHSVRTHQKGIAMVEVLVASAIMTLVILGVMYGTTRLLQISNRSVSAVQATALLAESAEVLTALRDESWENISTLSQSETHTIAFNDAQLSWGTVLYQPGTNGLVDGKYTRTFTVSPVYRNADDDIAETGTLDEGTLFIETIVSWQQNNTEIQRELSFYLADI